MGEFIAFLIGWTLILEYVIGSASVVRGLSTYVDALFNGAMKNAFQSIAPMDVSFMSTYPDFFAFAITQIFSGNNSFLMMIMINIMIYNNFLFSSHAK